LPRVPGRKEGGSGEGPKVQVRYSSTSGKRRQDAFANDFMGTGEHEYLSQTTTKKNGLLRREKRRQAGKTSGYSMRGNKEEGRHQLGLRSQVTEKKNKQLGKALNREGADKVGIGKPRYSLLTENREAKTLYERKSGVM